MIRHCMQTVLALAVQVGAVTAVASAQPVAYPPVQSLAGQYQINGRLARVEQVGWNLWFVNEYGEVSRGVRVGPNRVFAPDWNLAGTLSPGGIQWDNGTVWGNVGANAAAWAGNAPDISGVYSFQGRPTEVRQRGNSLWFINEWGSVSRGIFLSPDLVKAVDWDWNGLTGRLYGNRISWANGTVWWKR